MTYCKLYGLTPDEFERHHDEVRLTDEAVEAGRAYGLNEHEIAVLQDGIIQRSHNGCVEEISVEHGQFKVVRKLSDLGDGAGQKAATRCRERWGKDATVSICFPKQPKWDWADVWCARCSRF